jgi:hypothetical protein
MPVTFCGKRATLSITAKQLAPNLSGRYSIADGDIKRGNADTSAFSQGLSGLLRPEFARATCLSIGSTIRERDEQEGARLHLQHFTGRMTDKHAHSRVIPGCHGADPHPNPAIAALLELLDPQKRAALLGEGRETVDGDTIAGVLSASQSNANDSRAIIVAPAMLEPLMATRDLSATLRSTRCA